MKELICLLLLCSYGSLKSDNSVRPVLDDNKCQKIDVTTCRNLGYDMAYFPNFRGHTNISQAEKELQDFLPLVLIKCSNAILHFLCSFYMPPCLINPITNATMLLQPCQELCQYVKHYCEEDIKQSGFEWPTFFNCSLEPFSTDPSCFGPDNITAIVFPESLFATSPVIVDVATSRSITITSSSVTLLIACLINLHTFISN